MIRETHEFHASLKKSDVISLAPWWGEVYRTQFPYFESMELVASGDPRQQAGIDRIVHLKGGGTVYVDEKVRHDDYNDFLLETLSSVEQNTLGWAFQPLSCDYIAYAFLPSRRCYFLPFQLLQRAMRDNWDRWSNECKIVDAWNPGYTTRGIAVPIDVLMKALSEASVVHWKESARVE